MSKQRGRGGMGSHKHGTSGTAGQNRRALQAYAREVNKLAEKKRSRSDLGTDSIRDLIKKVGK